MSSTSPTRQVVVDDTNPSIVFTGTWDHDQGLSGIASASEEKILGPAFNSTATFSHTDSSLSFTFTGTAISVNGGINFAPTGTFGRCFIDGVVTDNSTELMIDSGVVGTNDNPLCTDFGLSDGTHILTFNMSGMGTYTPAPGANGVANGVWIDEIVYTPSSSVDMNAVPAIIVFPGDPQLNYSTGWNPDSSGEVQTTSQQNASVTFTFQGTSVDYYGTLLIDSQTTTSSATYSIDGQTPTTVSLVNFDSGTTPYGVPLFSSGKLPAGQHTLTVVNQGNSSVVPLALDYLIVLPSTDSVSVNTTTTTTTTTTSSHASTPNSTATTNPAITSASPTSATSPPSTNSASSLNNIKKRSSAAKIGAIVGVILGVLLIVLFLLLFFRRRRQKQTSAFKRTSILRGELEYPDISGVPPPEVPTPFPLPNRPLRNNKEMAQRSQDPFLTTSPPKEKFSSTGKNIRRPRQGQPPTVQGTAMSSQLTSEEAESPPIPPPSSSKDSVNRNRPLSDLIINHDDSGIRIPQPEEETPMRRVVEFPPTYAP